MVSIRLSRCGRTHAAKYRLVAADSRNFRDGKFLEVLGHYNPSPRGQEKGLVIEKERIEFWLKAGAQPTERVKSLIKEAAKN